MELEVSDTLAGIRQRVYLVGLGGWVEEITVKKPVRRRGVGKALMENFEEWSRSRGNKLVALAIRRATAFYASIGYEESATFFRKLL